MRVVIAGLGRAGTSLGLAFHRAGHEIAGVLGRSSAIERAALLDAPLLSWNDPIPASDLLVIAVRDDSIEEVAGRLAPLARSVGSAVHVSGLKPLSVLDPLAGAGLAVGSFHPLQSMPNPQDGAAALGGSWLAITARDEGLGDRLTALARSIGAHPFRLDDGVRALYHAAAASGANYVLTALALSARLFESAGVPFEAARPLVEHVVQNAFTLGPSTALTGPIARGDVGTVAAQLEAVDRLAPEAADAFRLLARATARLAGTSDEMDEVLS